MTEEIAKPFIFISHRHEDADIADVINEFITQSTGGGVDVFQSTSIKGVTPKIGKPLSEEIAKALHKSQLVLYLFTRDDADWTWCNYEIGLANNPDPNVPNTRTIVLQFGDAAPKPLEDHIRVDVRDEVSVSQFVKGLLTEAEFLEPYNKPLTQFHPNDKDVEKFGRDLYSRLSCYLVSAQDEDWRCWPYLQLKIALKNQDQLKAAYLDNAHGKCIALFDKSALVFNANDYVDRLFGFQLRGRPMRFCELIESWRSLKNEDGPQWVDSIRHQGLAALSGRFPSNQWAVLLDDSNGKWYCPVLTRFQKLVHDDAIYLHFLFIQIDGSADADTLSISTPFHSGKTILNPRKKKTTARKKTTASSK